MRVIFALLLAFCPSIVQAESRFDDACSLDPSVCEVTRRDKPSPEPTTPVGPDNGEDDADWAGDLSRAIRNCWNIGSASSDAVRTTVVVLVDMAPDGSPTGVKLVSSDGPTKQATDRAFQAARAAVLRCAKNNTKPLPADNYDSWKQIEMTFDPNRMRIK